MTPELLAICTLGIAEKPEMWGAETCSVFGRIAVIPELCVSKDGHP